MRVDPVAAALHTQLLNMLKGKEGGQVGAGFAAGKSAPPPQPSALPATMVAPPATSVAMLVAVAAASPTPLPTGQAVRRADRGLGALERLARLIRSGASTAAALEELAGWRDEGGVGEGAAGALLEEVELRILVELAKAGR